MPAVLTLDGIDSLITAAEAADLCDVSVVTIRGWANRGYLTRAGERAKLPVAGVNAAGHKVYRLIDVAKAEQATRERARRDRYYQAS